MTTPGTAFEYSGSVFLCAPGCENPSMNSDVPTAFSHVSSPVSWIVWAGPPGMLKSISSSPSRRLASSIAARSEHVSAEGTQKPLPGVVSGRSFVVSTTQVLPGVPKDGATAGFTAAGAAAATDWTSATVVQASPVTSFLVARPAQAGAFDGALCQAATEPPTSPMLTLPSPLR